MWVHIADVSAFVAPRSLVDREAYRRGTSVYVPGAVEPMLPEELSNGACSLVPGQDRLAVTVEMELVGARGQRAAFIRSLIRSDERLDYEQVDRIFAGAERARRAVGRAAGGRARGGRGARRTAQRRGGARGSIPPSRSSASIAEGHVAAARAEPQTESHRLIEHLMIAANEQVAGLLEQRGVPALYRVHERPESTAVERLVDQLASLGVPTPPVPGGHLTPQQAADLVGETSQLVARLGGAHAATARRGADEPRAALAQAGLLRPAQPRPRRPAVAALLPLHLADPPLSGSDLPPRAAVGDLR